MGCSTVSKMSEKPPRDAITGSRITDFMQLGHAKPWSNKIDFIHCLSMGLMLLTSFIKAGLMLKGYRFMTLNNDISMPVVLDCYEVLTLSTRFMAAFTCCFMAKCIYIGEQDL